MLYHIRGKLCRLLHRLSKRVAPLERTPNLAADRHVEWMFMATRMGRHLKEGMRVLDFGSGPMAVLSHAAATLGAHGISVDLAAHLPVIETPEMTYRRMDLLDLDEGEGPFDLVLSCSVIEHVGLESEPGQQGASERDRLAMARVRHLLSPSGLVIMTLPVGQDALIYPLHRVYGVKRLPMLLDGYAVVEDQYWRKTTENIWLQCSQAEAMTEQPRSDYYAIGCMVLKRD